MKIVIISDTHFGCRKNSVYFMEEQKRFYDNKFFPYLRINDIDTILHLGDFFDNRKTVNFETLRHAKECFMNPIVEDGLNLHMIVGNHDSYYKSNGDLTSTKLLFNDLPGVTVYDSLTELQFGDKSFLMVPWIFPIQKEETVAKLKLDTSDVCCGHFEMLGVVFQGSTVSRKGIDTDTFSHYPHVFSGHFHKKSQYYVGSPYAMSWSDYDDPKRIIIYDTDDGTTEDVYLADDTYFKIEYPIPAGQEPPVWSQYKDKIVRVLVKKKDNVVEFDAFIENLESFEPQEIDIKEEYLYLNVIKEDDLDDDTDTLGVLLSSIDSIEDLSKGERHIVKEIMTQLYNKAGESS